MLPISKFSIIYILIIQVARGIVAQVGDINDFFKGESHDLNSSPTLSGFIAADDIVFRVIKRINLRSSCLRMEFINIPFNTTSPLVGGRTFTLLKEKLVAGRFAWSNGPDFISFVATVTADAPYGTWMLSNKIGDESGYGFNKPRQPSLVPFDSTMRWSWLENKRWERNDDIQLICKDDVPSEGHFYQVEYFIGTQAHTGFYSPNMFSTEEIDRLIALNVTEDFTLLRSLARPTIWNNARLVIMNPELTSPPVPLVKFGSGTYITDRKGRKTVGHLVQQEHGANSGWNLAFRRVVGTEAEEKMSGWNFEDEIVLYLDGNPATPRNYILTPMTAAEEAAYMTYAHKSLQTIQKGQYVSICYHRSHVDELLVQLESNVDGTSRAVAGKKDDVKLNIVEEEVEILLECVARTQSKVLFKYHFSDRREVLYQDLLSKEATYFTYTLGSGNDAAVMTDASGIEIDLTYYEFIGSDVIGYIREYLKKKDNTLQHLSSCYFYHAAVTLPKALIYAAEIVCVLTGAKPLTLIQFSTPTDHQWKAPLVLELSHSIVRTKMLLGDAFDVEVDKYKYRKDESLVFYRTNRTYVAESLIPYKESQALHPLPYPDSKNPKPDWEKQIYNAWWNGYMLGYPVRFVDSYCLTFHNGLPKEEKQIQIDLAKKNAFKYMKDINKPVAIIRTGLEPSITDAAWLSIASYM